MPAKGHSGAGEIKSPVAARNRFAPICFAAGQSPRAQLPVFDIEIKGSVIQMGKKDGSYSSMCHSGRGDWAYALDKAASKRDAPMAHPFPRMDRIRHSARVYHARHRANAQQRCRIVAGDHCRGKGKRDSGAPFIPGYVIFGGPFILSLRRNSGNRRKRERL